jgi:hypothetical protein
MAQALVSADRTIEKKVLTAGSETNVNVIIKNDNTQTLEYALKESIPPGWSLIRISDDAFAFKTDTNEWIWIDKAGNNTDKNVKYRINIPPGTVPGTYMINGNTITTNTTTKVTGDNTITVSGGSSGGSSGSSGSSGDGSPTITATPEKNETVTVQPTITIAKQTTIGTAQDIATTNTKLPGFDIIISIGIIATIYIFKRMK